MAKKSGIFALAGTAVGVGVGLAAQRAAVRRRRLNDNEAGERFGERRGDRTRILELADGAKLFVEEAGPESKRGAIFIHGSALRTDVWHYQLSGIDDHRLVFYDLRGHGRSQPKGDRRYSIPTLVDDLLTVIEDSQLEEVVLVGHSVGGMIALDLCSTRPGLLGSKIRGVVCVNTTHRSAYESVVGGAAVAKVERVLRHPLDALGNYHHRVDRLRKIIKPSDTLFMAVSFAAFGPHGSAKQIDFTYDMLSETPTDTIFDLFKAYRDFDVTDLLPDVTVPVLVVTGSHDRITVPGASQFLAENLPKADLQMFDGSGHMTMLEKHRDFNAMLAAFFDEVLAGKG